MTPVMDGKGAHLQGNPETPAALRNRRILFFCIAAALPLVLALDDGGYGVVTRQTFGLILWAAIALGFAFSVLPRGRLTPLAWTSLGALGLLAGLTALSLLWTDSRERTFEEVARVLQYGGVVVLAFSGLNRHSWRAAAAGLATAALVLPLLALTARLAPDLITDDAARHFGIDRLSYPLGYWNGVAAWGAMAVALGLGWSAHARGTAVRALALGAVPPAVLAVYLTYSRGGVIATGIAIAAAIALARNRWTLSAHLVVAVLGSAAAILVAHDRPEIAGATGGTGAGAVLVVLVFAVAACAAATAATRAMQTDRLRMAPRSARIVAPLGVLLAVVAVGFGLHGQISDAWREFRDERTIAPGSNPASRLGSFGGNRYEVWQEAVDAFEEEPTRGIGSGTFEFYWAQNGDNPEFIRDAHSLYLENLAELGVPGAIAVLAFVLALLAAALAARREIPYAYEIGASGAATAAFIAYLFSAGVDWMWELPAIGMIGIGSAACAAAAAFPRWGRVRPRRGVRLAIVAAAVIAAAVQVPGLVSTQRLRASGDELRTGSADNAAELADQSVEAEPWAASPRVQRALVEQQAGNLGAARADFRKAIELEPQNWRHHFLLARLEAEAGDRPAVIAELAEVRRLAPRSVFLLPGAAGREQIDPLLAEG